MTDSILPQIQHVVVLMNENRSFDNLLGWLYADPNLPPPTQYLPSGSTKSFDGLSVNSYSNSNPAVNFGNPVYASEGTTSWRQGHKTVLEWFVPSPDPGEEFAHIKAQIFDDGADGTMGGFLTDYVGQVELDQAASAAQIMQSFSPKQLPVISELARSFAVSDAWYCSVPSQTLPNRGFVHTGSSDGKANNDWYLPYDINTVFDVLRNQNLSWMVYNDGWLQSATKTMFAYTYEFNETNFRGIEEFQAACAQQVNAPANQKLPVYSFVEPNFGIIGHDETYHPPHDVRPGELFLARIYNAIAGSPYRDNILFIVLFDEHGGTYDHCVPPSGAQPPAPGEVTTDLPAGSEFTFDRFGVRVPAIVISSWVKEGTVFRSNTSVPLDHTSVLATLRDWRGLSSGYDSMLPSPRIAAAPNLGFVLTEAEPRSWPIISTESLAELSIPEPDDDEPLNDVQRWIVIGAAGRVAGRPYTREESQLAYARLRTHGDARTWLMALEPHLPLK